MNPPTHSPEYTRGYDDANRFMVELEDAKRLRAQADLTFDRNDYYRGWIAACDDEIRIQAESDVEWDRINAMTPEQVRAELHAYGYTDVRIDAGIARCREMVEKAWAAREAQK